MEDSEPFLDMQIAYLTPLSLNFLTCKTKWLDSIAILPLGLILKYIAY